jgi:Flp pilus assembly CpaE family ATPase
VSSIGVAVTHPDPGIVDEVIHALESEGDLYLALDPAKASVILAGGAALQGIAARPPREGIAVVGLAVNGDLAEVSRSALRCRAHEIVCWPQDSAALRQILRDAASTARLDAGRMDGKVVAVAGARGGAGATTLAAMLARALEAVVVDLDPIGAGQTAFIADGSEPTLGTVLASVDDLDAQALAAALTPHASGVALCAEPRSRRVSPAQATRLAALVRAAAQLSVFDVGRVDDEAAREVLRSADQCVIVCGADVASMRGARGLLDIAAGHIVINHAARGRISAREVRRVLGHPPAATVPADSRVRRAGEAGRLARRGRARKAVDDFARRLIEETVDGS